MEETAAAAADVITFRVDCSLVGPGELFVFRNLFINRELDDITSYFCLLGYLTCIQSLDPLAV
ncbi:hypothetical protein BpHYR1_012503 [Brachionus plicatilis]|uniref:Uncharacterized protein n=1 Tax=Brachionus plicatilis TaxID=10195 RepID=A0A3M7SW67_BRAPC|nr:hypothetical protein BpHYR1_012503 [Brachionus plicatilis]